MVFMILVKQPLILSIDENETFIIDNQSFTHPYLSQEEI